MNPAIIFQMARFRCCGDPDAPVAEDEERNWWKWWNTFFIILCSIAVFIDPMFCYLKAIDNEHKCITTELKWAWAYIIIRTVTDVINLVDLLINRCGCRQNGWKLSILMTLSRIFVFLPITQVLVAVFFIKNGLKEHRPAYLILTPIQFVLRIYHIYGWLQHRSHIPIEKFERWLKPALDFLPFILASHLFGAFWYHLAVHVQTECWMSTRHQIYPKGFQFEPSNSISFVACKANPTETYDSGSNISRWDDLCPVKQADPKTFDFGIFFYALQSNVASSARPLLQRMFQSFWWGLRNLSSFGSNLNSSMDPWEILFSVLISIGGMALFIVYLNARLQASRARSRRSILENRITPWFAKYRVPEDMRSVAPNMNKSLRTVIRENIHKLKDKEDLDVQDVFSILPMEETKNIMRELFYAGVLQLFPNMNCNRLELICQSLMPVTYTEDSYIVRQGEPLGKMLLIVHGSACAVTYRDPTTSTWLQEGHFVGLELLNWNGVENLPMSGVTVISQGKVEAFAVRASGLR